MNKSKLYLFLLLSFFTFACASNKEYKNKNEFVSLIHDKGDWISLSTKENGEIEIVYRERLHIDDIVSAPDERYVAGVDLGVNRSGRPILKHYEGMLSDRLHDSVKGNIPGYYCLFTYRFNQSRELIGSKLNSNSCEYSLK